ncbi:unnamed protein product [Caenorhabditis auriculariae]|uniref:RING-type domain-containing protein n=1 Tax=Caenorhabditis auriculariae TaxID=2777116 RepID=A0A8S1HBQ4_9PELO|nr:unnamed protein product [Caenorhabditis auriculariae]
MRETKPFLEPLRQALFLSNETVGVRMKDTALGLIDGYTAFCEWALVEVAELLQSRSLLPKYLLELGKQVMLVPLTILGLVLRGMVYFIWLLLSPIRYCQWFATSFPFFTLVTLLSVIAFFYMVKRVSDVSFVNYFINNVLPYALAWFFTIVGFFFPQVHVFTAVMRIALHPVEWILGIAEKVDQRAIPIRRTVESLTREDRMTCSVCLLREKSVMVVPCQHLCMCDQCNDVLTANPNAICPVCRNKISSTIKVKI